MNLNKLVLSFAKLSLITFVTMPAWAQRVHFVGDMEGNKEHLQTLIDQNKIQITNGEIVTKEGEVFVTVGDIMRRGPHGKEIMGMMNRSEKAVKMIGNHDVNGIAFVVLNYAINEGLVPEYSEWATKRGLDQQQRLVMGRKLEWFMDKYGLSDKVTNFWFETIKEATGREIEEFKTNGRIDITKLNSALNVDVIAQKFYEYHAPGGESFTYLKNAFPVASLQNGRIMVTHSGQPTTANFGKVAGRHYIDIQSPQDFQRWISDYVDFRDHHLSEISGLISEYNRLQNLYLNAPAVQKAGIRQQMKYTAQNLHDNRFRTWGDAGWDHTKGDVSIDADSPVYPDKRVFSDTSLPGIPSADVLRKIVLAGIEVDVGGHFPVGDGPVGRIGIDPTTVKMDSSTGKPDPTSGKRVLFLTLDTSYSPVEGRSSTTIEADGTVMIQAQTRYGTKYILEYPMREKLEQMRASSDKAVKAKGEAIAKYGTAVNGYIIIGNVVETVNGVETVNYDNFLTVRQEGRNFSYKKVDIWGIYEAQKLGLWGVPEANLEELLKNAREKQKETLKAKNKIDLTVRGLYQHLRGKELYLISGPSQNSMDPLKKSNPQVLADYYKDFEARVRAIEGNREVVFIGGGTLGLESEMVKIIKEVNLERTTKGQKQFEIIGFITGVTADHELDPNVKKYYRLLAFYWDDYTKELFELLGRMNRRVPFKSFTAEYAGGGGILPKQILRDTFGVMTEPSDKPTTPAVELFSQLKVILNQGLNQIDAVKGVILSGTDKSINNIKSNLSSVAGSILRRVEVRDVATRRKASAEYRGRISPSVRSGPSMGISCNKLMVR